MRKAEYYQESFECAMDEAGCYHLVEQMTPEQRKSVGDGIAGSVECESMAFYSPPPSDRLNAIESEWRNKYRELEAEYEGYRNSAEKHMKRILRVHRDDPVSIHSDGVYRHGGRTEQIA